LVVAHKELNLFKRKLMVMMLYYKTFYGRNLLIFVIS
jgi:hypothetical protein